jgi:hypothetical protein
MALLARLSDRFRDILDGVGGNVSPLGVMAKSFRLGTRLEDLAKLGSTTADEGASLIAIRDAGGLITAINVETGLAELATKIAALGAENVDVVIPLDLTTRTDVSGTWAVTRQGTALYRLRRVAAAAIEVAAFVANPRGRSTALKGFKVTGVRVCYKVTTVAINDLTLTGAFTVAPATGAAVAAATNLGAVTYDAAHDTAAERKALGDHTLVATFATPVYLSSDLALEILLVIDGTATGVVDIWGIELLGSETLVDLA